jgi:hypothetical protein
MDQQQPPLALDGLSCILGNDIVSVTTVTLAHKSRCNLLTTSSVLTGKSFAEEHYRSPQAKEGYMRRRIAVRLIMLVCLSMILAGAARAQSAHSFEVEIPFPFILEDRTLPAGKYLVQRIDPAKPNVLMLKNADARIVRVVLTHRVESKTPSAVSTLEFLRRQEKLYLFQIWTGGDKNGNQIPLLNEEERRDRFGAAASIVRLRAKAP